MNLDALLSLSGEAFVRAAYRAALGREADDGGLRHYVQRLRAGDGKTSVIRDLLNSKEAQASNSQANTFREELRALLREEKARSAWWGWWRRGERIERRMAGLEARLDDLLNEIRLLAANGRPQRNTGRSLTHARAADQQSSSDVPAGLSGQAHLHYRRMQRTLRSSDMGER